MASKVTAFGRSHGSVRDDEEASNRESPMDIPGITAGMLNEAVEDVLKGAGDADADIMRKLWALDANSDAANAYFHSQVAAYDKSNFSNWIRPQLTLDEVLTEEQTAACVEYAPEYSLVLRNKVSHDHPLFSAMRKIDHQLLISKFPAGKRYIDAGGNIEFHVRRGDVNCVVVAPLLDVKDPMRAALSRQLLKRLSLADDTPKESRAMALSVLRDEGRYCVRETIQATRVKAGVSISCHVYDVDINDWAYMMENCGVRVHEGCLLFSNDFFDLDSGTLPVTQAYYEIDRVADTFRMRLGDGMSSWYEHKWSHYMRYGANQILRAKNRTYSYHVTERRGDTLFFRIIEVQGEAQPDRRQVYAMPLREMVQVRGFEVFHKSHTNATRKYEQFRKRTYYFPSKLWKQMHAYATAELDRGGIDIQKMFNHYRTVVPRQSINSVVVSGGEKVELDDVPALIVMASTVAAFDAAALKRNIRMHTDAHEYERAAADEWTIYKAFDLFVGGLKALGYIFAVPFIAVGDIFTRAHMNSIRQYLVTWAPIAKYKSLSMALFVDKRDIDYEYAAPRDADFIEYMRENRLQMLIDGWYTDKTVAADVLRICSETLPDRVKRKMQSFVSEPAKVDVDFNSTSSTCVPSDSAASVSGVPASKVVSGIDRYWQDSKLYERVVNPPRSAKLVYADRCNSIKEAINECRVETDAIDFTCAKYYRRLVTANQVDKRLLTNLRVREEMGNPDIWLIRSGIVVSSVLGQSVDEFSHSGVYTPVMDPDTGCGLRAIREVEFNGVDTVTGETVNRHHYQLFDTSYSGYALTVDSLQVFNGPQVVQTLKQALSLHPSRFAFDIVAHLGPPGCGKTTTVVKAGSPEFDGYLVPTRLASRELRTRLVQTFPRVGFKHVSRVCRTLDSFLVNYDTLPFEAKQDFRTVHVDEFVLARAGKWIAAFVLLGLSEVHVYGDTNQIKHIPRVDVPKLYLELDFSTVIREFITYRCAPRIAAMFSESYNDSIRSARTDNLGVVARTRDYKTVVWRKNSRALCMYQADKVELRRILADVPEKPIISTVHEAQGTQCDQVVLFNFETRKRTADDSFYLFTQKAHCLVAVSRARHEFIYVKRSEDPDVITQMMSRATDHKLLQLMSDLPSQGYPNLL